MVSVRSPKSTTSEPNSKQLRSDNGNERLLNNFPRTLDRGSPGYDDMRRRKPDYAAISGSARSLLGKKDFLSGLPDEVELRKHLSIQITGPNGSGKTVLTDLLWAELGSKGYEVKVIRASKVADERFTKRRRDLIRGQEEGNPRIKWYEVVDALREEGASGLENEVLPFLRDKKTDTCKKAVIYVRFPLADTLAHQLLEKSPLIAVAEHLRGRRDYEKSGYVKPKLTLLLECLNIEEAVTRIAKIREPDERGETTIKLGTITEAIAKIGKLTRAYHRVSGAYTLDKGIYTRTDSSYGPSRMYPSGIVEIIDTQDPTISYEDITAAIEKLRKNGKTQIERIMKAIDRIGKNGST